MKHLFTLLALAGLSLGNSGCCCGPRPWARFFGCDPCGGGCGERYYGDWAEGRPYCQDCCDCGGNWTGRPPGFAPGYHGGRGGYVQGGEQWSDGQVIESTPGAAEDVKPQQPTPAEPPTPTSTQTRRNMRTRPVSGHQQTHAAPQRREYDDEQDVDTRYRAPSMNRPASYQSRQFRPRDDRYADHDDDSRQPPRRYAP
ncbi:MAG: hypothetical protein JSS27_10710 [Planctomycetes bacterium]|nr:hypothetical protein [Planctomycetota bacterium]